MWDSSAFLGALTPKFYVALTGTSSLISGLILIFEWWYFRKYGTSFIEQVSLTHLGPWLGGGGAAEPEPAGECKVWRNPMALLRGAEYGRLWSVARRAPLTYYDMNLSAQEHQAWFSCGTEHVTGAAAGAEAAMARAWREREPGARVAAARAALALRPDCAPALLLLAEEDAPTVLEAERLLKRAWRCAEAAWRSSGALGAASESARRDAAVLLHVKRRCGVAARRLGRLRDAARVFRELARDAAAAPAAAAHENLIEVLLEQRAYADVQAVLARYDDVCLPRSATVVYTHALLRSRAAATAAASQPAAAARATELAATEAIRRAMDYNPFVVDYLLEMRPLTLPPEHVLRRGDSEAVAYAFFHLRHWRHAEGALALLGATAGAGGAVRGALACADRELLPPHHVPPRAGVCPAPASLPLCGALLAAALLALAALRWPALATLALDPARLHKLLAAV